MMRTALNGQSEQLAGHSIDRVLNVLDGIYLCVIALAAVLSVLIFIVSLRSVAAKDRALEAFRTSAAIEVEKAREQAQEADETAAGALARAVDAQRQTATADSQAARIESAALAQSVEFQRQNAASRAEAAEFKATNAGLEQQVTARRLTAEQASTLIAVLEHFKAQSVRVGAAETDPEASRYAQDFIHVFRAAKWHVGDDASQNHAAKAIIGLQIRCNPADCSEDHWLPSLVVLPKTLYKLGIVPDFSIVIDPEAEAKVITVLVGSKPLADQVQTKGEPGEHSPP